MTSDFERVPARRADGPSPQHPRRGLRDPRHLLAQGVHPADDAVPRQVRLLHVRPAAGPPRLALPLPRRGARHRPRRSAGRLPRGAVHAGRAPRGALRRRRATGSRPTATTPPSTTSRPWRSWCSTRSGCSPTPTPARCTPTSWPGCGRCRPRQGMMVESLNARPRRPPRLARQDARAAPGHPRGGRRAGHPVHHRHPRRHRRGPRRPHRRARGHRRLAPAVGSRAGGHRPELPAQAGHHHVPVAGPAPPTTTSTPSRSPG